MTLWNDIIYLLDQYGWIYLAGMGNTLILATVATLIGCLIGFACGVLTTIPHPPSMAWPRRAGLWIIRALIRIYVEVFRGTPMILQAIFIFYGLPYFTNNALQFTNIWTVSILVVSINTGAYIAESVRGGIFAVDPGQTEGARAIGMSHVQTMLYVVLPQALRSLLPQIGNNLIINIKDTSVMFIIGFSEFFSVHKMVSGAIFKYFPSATIEMVGYLTVTLLASVLLRWFERRLDGDESYELVNSDQLVMAAGTYTFREPRRRPDVVGAGEPNASRAHDAGGRAQTQATTSGEEN
ncbi:putative lysine transport system permease protein [Arcanobacterium wilhelmae]|uniref:Lysine transport system permease protein n=1 Tax=Arcanobacterium wilhelmae TaxID=1803177 RepID=A0ABT9NES0_9ACTO|nr:amino acid ABC transporter permease [Arcanobacterium wilhelmae]MDP9801681.1 putative lysine transport system permease protein [Arcanobacterium wilhelmae]WFN91002.1 amino acid ABC transporter permease [Arcanobacterium wilhelmae]